MYYGAENKVSEAVRACEAIMEKHVLRRVPAALARCGYRSADEVRLDASAEGLVPVNFGAALRRRAPLSDEKRARIVRLKKRVGMSAEEVAFQEGVAVRTVYRVLRGFLGEDRMDRKDRSDRSDGGKDRTNRTDRTDEEEEDPTDPTDEADPTDGGRRK